MVLGFATMDIVRSFLISVTAVIFFLIGGYKDALAGHLNDAESQEIDNLMNAPIEQLGNLDYIVTSASKHKEKILNTPAAIYVITQEDIKNSGVKSVPEALRMAPGINVARINSSVWAISIRGFADQYGNKLLVLVDGRSVYTPIFAGVYWDEQTLPLDDIDRIEVIRGPGATLWGANAVNGVINIITKKAKDTQGNLLTFGGGTHEPEFGTYRYGGKAGNAYWRSYITGHNHDEAQTTNTGHQVNFDRDNTRAGFRIDWDKLNFGSDSFTLQSDIYRSHINTAVDGHALTTPYNFLQTDKAEPQGGNVLIRWERKLSSESNLQVQAYVDSDVRVTPSYIENDFSVNTKNYDVEIQHSYRGWERQNIVWGAGSRITQMHIGQKQFIGITPANNTTSIFSAFAQDEISLVPDKFFMTLGSKIEHNSYTGFEVQPSIKGLWKITDVQSIWAAVSRAVRTPTLYESKAYQTVNVSAGPTQVKLLGNNNLSSEKLIAYELGYRTQIAKNASFDATAFYNDYDDLIGTESSGLTLPFTNNYHGRTYGAELAPSWKPMHNWQLKGSYSFMLADMKVDSGHSTTSAGDTKRAIPKHQFSIFSYLSLPHDVDFDAALYYVDNLVGPDIDSYFRADARLAWEPVKNVELSLVGQNLLDSRHYEFQGTNPVLQVPIDRSFYAKATLRF